MKVQEGSAMPKVFLTKVATLYMVGYGNLWVLMNWPISFTLRILIFSQIRQIVRCLVLVESSCNIFQKCGF